jgi:hypothetical protein
MEEKLAARAAGAAGAPGNPFVDPEGCRRHVEAKERTFREELERQRSAAGAPDPASAP